MGFPVGYTEIFIPKLLLNGLSFLGFIHTLISSLFLSFGLSDFLLDPPDSHRFDPLLDILRVLDSPPVFAVLANAQEKFMRIKHAYNTLLKSKDGRSGFSYSTSQRSGSSPPTTEDEFYGLSEFFRDIQMTLEDFFKDLQDEFRNWESSVSSQGKTKSLWEELAEIGEEFVELLEEDLNITDSESQAKQIYKWPESDGPGRDSARENPNQNKDGEGSSIEENIDEVEADSCSAEEATGLII